MVHYKLVKVIINILELVEVIIDIVVCHHDLPDSIISNQRSVFTLKFQFSFCYFLSIKKPLSTTFYSQIDSQIKGQNSIIKAYLKVFVNFEQNDQAKLLPIVKFIYNKVKNVNTNYTLFELNFGYHFWIFYKEDINFRFKSSSIKELLSYF